MTVKDVQPNVDLQSLIRDFRTTFSEGRRSIMGSFVRVV
jgi:hypothetical protein